MIAYLLKINGTLISDMSEWELEYNKLWDEAGRNMAGDLYATLIGVFPKIKITFSYLTGPQLATITALLNQPSFSVEYWDVETQSLKTANYYASDYSLPVFMVDRELYKPFQVSLIPYRKRS